MTARSLQHDESPEPETAALVVAQRAKDHALDPGFVLGRFIHSSFVSRRHRFLYIETPKAACTKLKHFIAELEGVPGVVEKRPYLRETRLQMLVHQRRYLKVPTLLDLEPADVRSILSGHSDYLIFALVRNPYSRLVSAFENKVRLREPGFGDAASRWAAAESGADVRATFADFAREAIPYYGQKMREHHFVPQSDLLMPRLLPYSRFYQVECFAEFERSFLEYLQRQGAGGLPEFRDRNRSLYPNWRLYYDESTARLVADFYGRDFETFGYDLNSWRLDHAPPPLLTSPSDAHWRQAVIERNEMIEFLFEGMKVWR